MANPTREAQARFGERSLAHPRPGFFKVRLRSRGPWTPAKIEYAIPMDPLTGEILDRSPMLTAFIDGREVDVPEVWEFGREIDREEYEWLRAILPLSQ